MTLAIEAGYELDRRVAEACGIEFQVGANGEIWTGDNFYHCFQPHKNWNDAMLASEKCGIDFVIRYSTKARVWVAYFCDGEVSWTAKHKTGPVAICLAILKLQEAT